MSYYSSSYSEHVELATACNSLNSSHSCTQPLQIQQYSPRISFIPRGEVGRARFLAVWEDSGVENGPSDIPVSGRISEPRSRSPGGVSTTTGALQGGIMYDCAKLLRCSVGKEMEFVGAAEREECARACLRAGVGAELDAEAEDEDVEVDLEDKLVLLSDEAMYLLEVVDLLLRRSGRGRDAGMYMSGKTEARRALNTVTVVLEAPSIHMRAGPRGSVVVSALEGAANYWSTAKCAACTGRREYLEPHILNLGRKSTNTQSTHGENHGQTSAVDKSRIHVRAKPPTVACGGACAL
ncbi:hypothetical protein B0H13DRAFT_2490346 [Mycena leptocephala]|nr:hypothetical protein B0H13DRAFT_2490346 [Mycena leptocephala]